MDTTRANGSHAAGDEVLSFLADVPGLIGEFVRSYPGIQASAETDWVETWFSERTTRRFKTADGAETLIETPDPPSPATTASPQALPLRLQSVHPHYFRGFRQIPTPILMDQELVVIEGTNSSGKTSLAEALEWLLTGRLSRRECKELGNPRELKNCVANVFRPEGEDTWVNGVFVCPRSDGPGTIALRRVLREDYGTTSTSECSSVLFLNERELSAKEGRDVLDRLFASVPPLLMQHTLRLFVQSDPGRRREYFERLLRLDQLTDLVSRAVIGDARLPEFLRATGSTALGSWDMLESLLQTDSGKSAHRSVLPGRGGDLTGATKEALALIARAEFGDLAQVPSQLEEVAAALGQAQAKARQESFPLLDGLRPQKDVSGDRRDAPYVGEVARHANKVQQAYHRYHSARTAAESIGGGRLAIAEALQLLVEANVIDRSVASQLCPICAYEPVPTLTRGRLAEIEDWAPIQEAERAARQALEKAMELPIDVIGRAIQEHDGLLPMLPPASEWEKAQAETGPELKSAIQRLRNVRHEDDAQLQNGLAAARELATSTPEAPATSEACEAFIRRCTDIARQLDTLPAAARRYGEAFAVVEAAVGAEASADPQYRLRQAWLACFDNAAEVVNDLRWEQAKRETQKELQNIRNALIDYRQRFLDARRTAFGEGIQEIWDSLRSDRYSRFSKLHIPPPRGKGFPVEIEVKAVLDDGKAEVEVDALRVFSESQVNALGVAAFVTRSRLLQHEVLILDDPVQSMDEEHFKTFARDLLPHVLEQGFQVIILTHNATFARDVSSWHYDRDGYATMTVRHSRREGCVVEEGNRRVLERLRLAETKVEQAKLPDAWKYIRLAIERLYTVAYAKYGPRDFQQDAWQNQTAEYMWNAGAGEIITKKVPDSGKRLKEILEMSAAGGHDKPPRGETDLRQSIGYLRELLSTLRVGG